MTKNELRRRALQIRRHISHDSAHYAALAVARIGLAIVRERMPQKAIISAYWPILSELSTLPLLEGLDKAGFRIALPVFTGQKKALQFRLWRPDEPLTLTDKGLSEPDAGAPAVSPDMLFLPVVAFDQSGHRIGYGAGNFDVTLSLLRAHRSHVAVGLAYDAQEVAEVPSEPHDEKLNFILTESRILLFGGFD